MSRTWSRGFRNASSEPSRRNSSCASTADPDIQTLDLAGNVKFGPDVEPIARVDPVDKPGMDEDQGQDWWERHLRPSEERKDEMARAIQDYVRFQHNLLSR
jgi:hypothetical protein